MADALTQDQRAGQLTTPLGDDVLVLGRLTADEGLSELFEIRVEALSAEANLDFAGALGLGSTIKYTTNDNLERYFNGVMTEAHWAGASDDVYRYQFVLRPWLWLLTRTSDSRIFAAMTALDIVKQVFNDRGFSAFLDRTTVTPPTLEYCVQYRETDFNFVCRLMEEYGIYYYFVHSDGQHMLVFADAETSHDPISQLDALDFIPTDDGGRREAQFLASWSLGRRAQSGKYSLNDYDYNKPSANLLASSQKPGGYANDSMEIFDFPGDYNVQADGATLAKVKAEAAQSLDKRRYASGEAPSLFPGALVTLAKHPLDAENQKYLVTHCSHSVDAQTYRSGAAGARRAAIPDNYELMPSDRQFRAPIATRKPEVAGVQSALVVGRLGRGDRRRRARPCARPVLLGPQEDDLSPRSGRPVLGGRPSRRVVPAAHRRRSTGPIRGGRSRSPGRCRLGLQQRQHRPHGSARQEDEFGDSHPIEQGRRRLQHAAVRRHRGRGAHQVARPEGSDVQGAEQRAARHPR